MSEVSYSNVPPMMAAIKSGDIEAIRSLLHAGHSPNEPQCYQVMIGDWPRDDEASPLELAVLENRMDMVQLLIECGADLTHNPEELLCGSLRSQDLTLFSFLVDVGVRIPATQRDICRLFLHLVDRDEPNVLPILKRMSMDLKQYGGEALRSMASHGNQLLVEYLIQNGADINYPVAAGGKAGACPHCPAKWNTEKPHDWPRESLYPGTCFVGRAWTTGLVGRR